MKIVNTKIFDYLLDMLFPRKCPVCGEVLCRQEPYICIGCLNDMPLTRLHEEEFNPVEQLFAGKVPIERASGMFYYSKDSSYAAILHDIKYRNQPKMGKWMACYLSRVLLQDEFFEGIDYLVPIPLHFTKESERGYNQSEFIALGISDATKIPIIKALKAVKEHSTQTHKRKYERWQNTKDIFTVTESRNLEGKHIMIIDDVITTGATTTSAALELHKISNIKISILSLAVARL